MTEKASVYKPDKGVHHSVFRHFRKGLEEITFLPVVGTTVKGERTVKAIVKAKMGLKRASQLRRTSSDLTIHCFPEDFDDVVNIQDVLHSAIRWKGRNYSLDGATLGKNYATGEVEHITFNCSLAIYTDDRPKFCLENSRARFLTTETGRIFMVEQFEMPRIASEDDRSRSISRATQAESGEATTELTGIEIPEEPSGEDTGGEATTQSLMAVAS